MRQSDSTLPLILHERRTTSARAGQPYWYVRSLAVVLCTISQVCVAGEPVTDSGIDLTQGNAVHIDPDADPAELISAYNLFKNPRHQIPNDGIIPYDLRTPHFSDYATLHRFVWVPKGLSCRYGPHGEIKYPIGATIIITIGYAGDFRDDSVPERIIETRLWIRKTDGWSGAQYVWNKETTEARLSLAGERIEVSWIHSDGSNRHHTYRVPNRNQCIQCHEISEKTVPLGPVHARYLNKDYHYRHGPKNQLQYWVESGILSGLPEQEKDIPRVPVWNDSTTGDVNARARAYLDMNCSSCHRKGGIAITSGLDLTWEQNEPVRFGVFKAPVAAGRSAGNGRFVIEPGQPEKSILLARLQSTDPGIRMPIVGRGIMHAEGVELIRQWISEMKYPEMTARQQKIDQRLSSGLRALQKQAAKTKVTAGQKDN